MAKSIQVAQKKASRKVKRKGVVSKTKTSHLKSSKLYKKEYRGQGR